MDTEANFVAGIDLGTSNTCVAVYRNGSCETVLNDLQKTTTPSYVGFFEDGRIFGDPAKQSSFLSPENTLFHIKRLMGKRFNDPETMENSQRWPFKVVDMEGKAAVAIIEDGVTKVYTPEEISGFLLRHVKQYAEARIGGVVQKAVITVPANCTDSQRRATKRAGELAGFEVIGIINEPTAAAVAYGLHTTGEKTILVFDFGGGTLDISILTISDGQTFKVKATSGFMHLGGNDFDERLIQKLKEDFEGKEKLKLEEELDGTEYQAAMSRLRAKAEEAKITLSSGLSARVIIDNFCQNKHLKLKITRAEFDDICGDLFNKIHIPVLGALENGQLNKGQIDQVVLVGGSSRMPKVYDILRAFFTEQTIHRDISPSDAIALGAASYAHALQSAQAQLRLIEIIPRSLGVEVYGGWMAVIIPKHTIIPCTASRVFTTIHGFTEHVNISVYEGDGRRVEENRLLNGFVLDGILKAPAGVPKIDVTFAYDVNGILKVTAEDLDTGESTKVNIRHNRQEGGGQVAVMLDASEEERENAKRMLRTLLEDLRASGNDATLKKLRQPAACRIHEIAFSVELLPITDYANAHERLQSMFTQSFVEGNSSKL